MKQLTIIVNPKQIKNSPHQALLIQVQVDNDQDIECTDGQHKEEVDRAVLESLCYNIVGAETIGD
ncbi:MAG: hypothetical protein GWP06_06115 [Actinobacteria bacterium]|nr:hypothetical protein [Actinomycetota bacterium]